MNKKLPLSVKLREFVFNLLSKFLKLKSCPVIFCFHSVNGGDWVFNVQPEKFEQFVTQLNKKKKIVGIGGLLNKSKLITNDKVAITFDDGYESVFTNAYPILKKYRLTACVFINGIPDEKGEFGYLDGKKLFNLRQIIKLKRAGWEIGYHTKSHFDLRKLTDKELKEEVVKGKKKIEKRLNFKLNYFAYPHGLFNKKVLKIVKEAGYKHAFTVNGGHTYKKEAFNIGRLLVDRYIKADDVRIIASCQGLYFNKLLTRIIKVKDNLLKI